MRRAAPAAVLALLALAGCGSPPGDLFAVERSGQGHNARLVMVVSDGGYVTCNGHQHPLAAERLLAARALARDLSQPAELHLELPARPGTVLSYRVRLKPGSVAFADTSANLPASFSAVQAFTKNVSEDVCGIKR